MMLYSNNKRPCFKKKSSKMSVIRHVTLKKSNLNIGSEEKEKNMKRSNQQLMDEKRQSTAYNTQDGGYEVDRNSRNFSGNNRNAAEDGSEQKNPFSLL